MLESRSSITEEIVVNPRGYQDRCIEQEEERNEANIINEENILIRPILYERMCRNQ